MRSECFWQSWQLIWGCEEGFTISARRAEHFARLRFWWRSTTDDSACLVTPSCPVAEPNWRRSGNALWLAFPSLNPYFANKQQRAVGLSTASKPPSRSASKRSPESTVPAIGPSKDKNGEAEDDDGALRLRSPLNADVLGLNRVRAGWLGGWTLCTNV